MYIVVSKLKELIKNHKMMMSGDFPEALNTIVEDLAQRAVQRANANGRKTVRPEDL